MHPIDTVLSAAAAVYWVTAVLNRVEQRHQELMAKLNRLDATLEKHDYD